jgi:hypothetical protein
VTGTLSDKPEVEADAEEWLILKGGLPATTVEELD